MKRLGWLGSLVAAIALTVHPAAARADDLLTTLVQLVPPLLLSNEQPYAPADGYIWQPGYWSWSQQGNYYWVPGEWVQPPQTGDVWTPGYWASSGNGYSWNPGYWDTQVGYYGGVNYGDGYYGNGYVGGRWDGHTYRYNRAVTRVNEHIRNVYVDNTVIVNRRVRTSYNGGHGVNAHPTAWQQTFAHQHHRGPTAIQQRHVTEAARDPHLRWNGNTAHRIAPMPKSRIEHQQPQHQPAVHQQPVHQRIVHQQPQHQPVVHQQPVHQRIEHQQPQHQPVVHQQPVHQRIVHQQPQHQPVVHQQHQPAQPTHTERAPHPHSSGHPG